MCPHLLCAEQRSRTLLPKTWLAIALGLVFCWAPSFAGPTVVPTDEGQLGDFPNAEDQLVGSRFESIRGDFGDLIFGGILVGGGVMPPPPEMQFLTDMIHGYPEPVPIDSTPAFFDNVDKQLPASAWSRNAADDGDFVAFSFAVDGAAPETMTVRIATFDETGSSLVSLPINTVGTIPFPDPAFSSTGVAVDNQGRATVAYTDFDSGTGTTEIRADRIDAATGTVLDPSFLVNDDGNHVSVDVALLDPSGNRLIVVTTVPIGPGNTTVEGNMIDFSGGTPMVLPEFQINSTTPVFNYVGPVVAADPATGNFTVAWEDLTAVVGNPADIRARRFDAMGNPLGGDFIVNTTTAESQGQVDVAYGPGGQSVIVWAGDATTPGDELDVFGRVYDAAGNPLGGDFLVNTTTAGFQDRPSVGFLPELDALGQAQFAVTWRDADNADGTMARGTGTSYKCFSIGEDPTTIFADGFESGDTSAWGLTNP